MKQLFFFIIALCCYKANAQYYYKQHLIPLALKSPAIMPMAAMADSNFVLIASNDSLVMTEKVNAISGGVMRSKGINLIGHANLRDAGYHDANINCYPTQDTGLVVVALRMFVGVPHGTDSSTFTVLKMDKELNVQWALQNRFSGSYNVTQVYGAASDTSGNVYFNYYYYDSLHGPKSGFVKVAPNGTIALSKIWAGNAMVSGNLYALKNNQLMLCNWSTGVTNSSVNNIILDSQLNLVHQKKFIINENTYSGRTNLLPVYNQPLIAGSISIMTGNNLYGRGFYIMDTAGNLLKIAKNITSIGTPPYYDEPVTDVNISANNMLTVYGYNDNINSFYLQTMDTACNTVFTMAFSGRYCKQAPFITGQDIYWNRVTFDGYTIGSNDLIRFKADGTELCTSPDAGITQQFQDVSFQGTTPTASLYLVNDSMPVFHPVTLDTLTGMNITLEDYCEPTAVPQIVAKKTGKANVIRTTPQQVLVQLPDGTINGTFELRDISGRLITRSTLHSGNTTVAVPALPASIYIWQVYHNNRADAGKLFFD